jgi:hypothetical protein
MRLNRGRSPDETREQYLGAIAPLLTAARNVESLSAAQKMQVRKRVLRTVLGRHHRFSHFRLTPVMVCAGLLVVAGGVAFATAGGFRLMFRSDPPVASAPERTAASKRAATGLGRRSQPELDPLPVEPSPPLQPESPPSSNVMPWQAGPALAPAPKRTAGNPPAALQPPPPRPRRKAIRLDETLNSKRLALAVPYLAEPVSAPPAALEIPSVAAFAVAPPPSFPVPAPPAVGASMLVAPSPPGAAGLRPDPTLVDPTRSAVAASDPVLFGEALRKLRTENDAPAALSILQRHAQAYPRSPLAGERSALQVQALLALHRDREALQQLDSMHLEELPRGGERLVVRGELRAAAKRWEDAKDDFDRALSRVSGSPAWHERALWGRGVAHLRCGERELGMEDIERYRDLYPRGRFAAEAARFFPGK